MNQPFDTFSEAEQALYTLGFNNGYNLDRKALENPDIKGFLTKEYALEHSTHPYSQGLIDGMDTNQNLSKFMAGLKISQGKEREDDHELDL